MIETYSESEALDILAEIVKSVGLPAPRPAVTDYDFPTQAKFIADRHFRKAAQCTRRAGKSNGVGRALYREAYRYPGSTVLYLALTRGSAKNIMWDSVIKQLDKDLKIGGKPNETELLYKIPHLDSKIQLAGADATHEQMEKFLGGKYPCVIIDEAGSFRQDLRKLVYENLEPAVSDYEFGWVGMIGTPTEITNGLFFDVTNGTEAGWSVHKWQTSDNPYMAKKWAKRIALLKQTNPRVIETPAFKRMYLNQWVIDTESLCYKYNHEKNDLREIPSNIESQLNHVLGVDLGFNDSSAFIVTGFTEYHRDLFIREPYKRAGMIVSDVAKMIEYYIQKYHPIACVIDNASKQVVEELKQRFNLPLEAADKQGKAQFIEIMNADFIQGYIKLVGPECEKLRKEYANLIWDADAKPKKWIEHPACENHLCFVAGTKIRVPGGEVSIEVLKIGDLVETRKGPRRIKNTIGSYSQVIKLQISDGSSVICTPDHPFWSNGKWISAQYLTKMDHLFTWNQLQNQRELYSKESITTVHLAQNILEPALMVKHIDYIKRYGDYITEKYQSIIISIIKTIMLLITESKISHVFLQKITSHIISKKDHRRRKPLSNLRESNHSQNFGIDQKKVENGISNTEKTRSLLLKQNVHGVIRHIKSLTWPRIKSDAVLKDVLPQREDIRESTILNLPAHGASLDSLQTNMPRKNAVVCVAQVSLKGKEKVFNITVEEEHEYFANDMLVSNCDAALYAWRKAYPYLSRAKPPKKSESEEIDEWFNKQAEEHDEETAKPYWER